MLNRKPLLTVAVAGSLLVPALSNASQTFETTNDEIGLVTHYAPTSATREQVLQDLAMWKAQPITSGGWREIESDQAWQAPTSGIHHTPHRPLTTAAQKHEHWRAVDGEAGWVGPFGV